jgi:polyhydroxybutyrate depolymerase
MQLARALALLAAFSATLFVAWLLLLQPGHDVALAAAPCDATRAHEAGNFHETIESGGESREYLLHIPPSYTGSDATPLVLNFHGLGSNAQDEADYTGMPAKADAQGFITIAPQGLVTDIIGVNHWNNTQLETHPDDVRFVGDLIDKLEAQLCIDPARVFSTGMSMGAMMSTRLACNLSDRIAAIAPASGLYYPPLADELTGEPGCTPARPVPIIAFHGTDDPIVEFNGGKPTLPNFQFQITFHSIEGVVLPTWAAQNGCDATPAKASVTEHVRLVRYDNCDHDATVEMYIIEGGGHTWPDATRDIGRLGETTHEISATDLLWEFFQAHPLRAAPNDSPQLPNTGATDGNDGMNNAWYIAIGAVAAAAVLAGGAVFYLRRR